VISTIIRNAKIHRLFVGTGSSCDILFLSTFQQIEIRKKLEDPIGPRLGFTRHPALIADTIDLPMMVGEETTTVMTKFLVLNVGSPYNGIIEAPRDGSSGLDLPSYMKFPTNHGISRAWSY